MEVSLVDTDVLIDYKRAKQKENAWLVTLAGQYEIAVSTISVFELLRGQNQDEDLYWHSKFTEMRILDFDYACCTEAARVYKELRSTGQPIGIEDVLIAAVALTNGLRLATGNRQHFSRIGGLTLLTA